MSYDGGIQAAKLYAFKGGSEDGKSHFVDNEIAAVIFMANGREIRYAKSLDIVGGFEEITFNFEES